MANNPEGLDRARNDDEPALMRAFGGIDVSFDGN